MLVGTSLLLVSTLPVWSFKNFKIPSEYVLPMLLGIGLYAALLVADPWAALAAASLVVCRHAAIQPAQLPAAERGSGGADGSQSSSQDGALPQTPPG